jgi:hypothetical protein
VVVTLIKKENKIFLIYKEIQTGAVAKSYMRKGFLILHCKPGSHKNGIKKSSRKT